MSQKSILLIDCPDQRGIVAAVSVFLFNHAANILHADQHQDAKEGLFFMRIEVEGLTLDATQFAAAFAPIAAQFSMNWQLHSGLDRPRVALFVSHLDHCLHDLLHRYTDGELPCDIRLIISNHRDTERLAIFHGIPFHHFKVTKENKPEIEAAEIALLEEEKIDLIVLARYMQVLSPAFVARYPQRIINVHHSFLPAFSGAKPYQQAFDRAVKIIGATSHYVTDVLDDGPIIEQDVTRISHRDSLDQLVQRGRDVEKLVLSRAVAWHLHRRILVYGNGKKTVIFD